MTTNTFEFIVSRIVQNAYDSLLESKKSNDNFYKGKKLAYYEVLNTLQNELIVRNQNLKNYGLDIDLEKTFL